MLCVVTCFVHSQFLLVRGVKPKCKSYLFLLIIYLAIIFKPGTFCIKLCEIKNIWITSSALNLLSEPNIIVVLI